MKRGGWTQAESYRDLIKDKEVAISLEQQLKSIGEALASQYLVTYARPSGAPTPTNIQAVSKKGLKALTGPWVR